MLDRNLLIVSGKGGVGKSAVAASLAIRASRLGKTVLAIGMVDSLGLAGHFGVEDLDYEPREVHPGVDSVAVDRARALDEYLRVQLRVPRPAPTRQLTRAAQLLVDAAPGVREVISMGKPIYEAWRGNYDTIIVDAAPLGQLLSYLRAPATVAGLVPSGTVRDQAELMRTTLADPEQTALVLVTTPEELPAIETREAIADLDMERLVNLAGVITNRVLSPLDVSAEEVEAFPPSAHRSAALLHTRIYASQQRWLERLPAGPRLPFLFGLLTPGEVAARLADVWEVE